MRIHTDTLTIGQVRDALPTGVTATVLTRHGSHSRNHAFEVRLSGSSTHWQWDKVHKAATWDEWGTFLADVFAADKHAIAGTYDGLKHFDRVTCYRFDGGGTLPEDTHPQHKWVSGGAGYVHCQECSAAQTHA